MNNTKFFGCLIAFLFLSLGAAAGGDVKPVASFRSGQLTLEIGRDLRMRATGLVTSVAEASDTVTVDGKPERIAYVAHESGEDALIITAEGPRLKKTIRLARVDGMPDAVAYEVTYQNKAKQAVTITGWKQLELKLGSKDGKFWSFQPGSFESRPNWLLPLRPGFRQKNSLGMNATDYGGGTPLAAVWTKEAGLAVGSLETTPHIMAFPISQPQAKVAVLAVEGARARKLEPGEEYRTPRLFATAYHGDAFVPLRRQADYLEKFIGPRARVSMKDVGPIWCAWGYGREFTVDQIRATLPLVKELGFEWVGIDDGWQKAIGDWTPNPRVFPKGEEDVKKLVEEIHRMGLKAQLWWAPLAVHRSSDAATKKPEELLLNADGKPRDISWWDAWYLCPAEKSVRDDIRGLTTKFLKDWGFDGLKIDGQHLNASPECFNPKHRHAEAVDSYVAHPQVFKEIYETAQRARSNALVETCPCGTAVSVYNLMYQNMTVGSDPTSSLQVRQKGKLTRAITGDGTVYFGDHVELSKNGVDYASSVGIGGVPGSNFNLAHLTDVKPPPTDPVVNLSNSRRLEAARWVALAKEKRLWEGEYLGQLYDMGFDQPEGHAIRKDGRMYYAFYADRFTGTIPLRGLEAGKRYRVVNYETGVDLGTVAGDAAELKSSFGDHLLLEAVLLAEDKADGGKTGQSSDKR